MSVKPQKPGTVAASIPSKVFKSSSGYNSSKNLRGQGASGNNRYSSQHMKSFELEEETLVDNEEERMEIADENFCSTEEGRVKRRESYRYKDLLVKGEIASKEGKKGV